MIRSVLFLSLLLPGLLVPALPAQQSRKANIWKQTLTERLPLLGHRNWILVVDSAYPLQTSPGVEVVETDAGQIEVTRAVLAQIKDSIHVRPVIFMDAELPFLTEEDSPGANAYRQQISAVLHNYTIQNELHEQLIAQVSNAGKEFRILVLKTRLTVPYSSVFIRLDCKYVSADAEDRLRARMKSGVQP
ncbi:hypothetical protein FTW19_10805 [Terriglobus albidus]|uniref:D-ribose pyranase n=1 Tax=Terriglobus albidus TaxID=1592106 RepID=A0A5B9EEG3_9BACT|nr:RbsD/FucU domain-containing protein [Terriglobus albidus]QEE28446.1 hypothetical protein FTW19_10805 [Terriglobus albidus]